MGLQIVRHDLMTKQQQPSSEADPKVHNDTSAQRQKLLGRPALSRAVLGLLLGSLELLPLYPLPPLKKC